MHDINLDITLRLIFVTFSQFDFSHFWAQLLMKLIDIKYLVSTTPPTIFLQILLKLYRDFCQGRKICITFGYNLQINFFITFSQFESFLGSTTTEA